MLTRVLEVIGYIAVELFSIAVSISRGLGGVAFSLYASYVVTVLFCVYRILIIVCVDFSHNAITVIFFAATVLMSRRLRKLAA